jgi:hypothetical protein
MTLKFFYSKKIASDYAQISAYAGRVRDLLREYAGARHGKIILEDVDPEPYTPAEDEATAAGFPARRPIPAISVYFGLVGTNTIDGKESFRSSRQEREALSRIRHHLADLPAVDAEEAHSRNHLEPAARHRRRRHDGGAMQGRRSPS